MAPPSALIIPQFPKESRDARPVDIVPSTLTLRLQDVILALLLIRRDDDGGCTSGAVVKRVDGREGGADALDHVRRGRAGEKAREVRGVGRGELLLDFLASRQVRQNGGTFDCC